MNLLPNNASQWAATWREPGVDRALRGTGLRVTVDSRADKIGAKIRQAQLAKVPFMLVLGPSSLVRSRACHH